jgi:hypothetical protein
MRITVGERSYDLADLPEEILRELGIIEDDPFARFFPHGVIHRPYNPPPIVTGNEDFLTREQLAQLWKQAVAQKKRLQGFITSPVSVASEYELSAQFNSPSSGATATQPATAATQQPPLSQAQNYLKKHFQSARPTAGMPAYLPDWSIKFTPILSSLDDLTRGQLQSYKNEAYNRYAYFQYQLKIAQRNHLPVDIALYQAESDYWSTVFRKVDTALTNAGDVVIALNRFLSDNADGPLVYGSPYSGPTFGSRGNPEWTVYTLSRPFGQSLGAGVRVAIGAQPGPIAKELPEVDDDSGLTDPKLGRGAINPDNYSNETLENTGEAAPAVAQGLAGGLNELLSGGRVKVGIQTYLGARYIIVQSISTNEILSASEAREVLSNWAKTPDADLPKAPEE